MATPERVLLTTDAVGGVWTFALELARGLKETGVHVGLASMLDVTARFQPDVVHLNQYSFGHLPFSAPVLITGHSCVLSWWRAVHGCDAPAEWSSYRYYVARGLHAAGLVAAPSRAMLAALETHYGPFPRTRVIPNGRDLPAAQRPAKQPVVFAAGRFWDEAKNLETLERIAPRLPWPVYVAGDLDHPDGTRRASSTCRLLGKLSAPQVAWWMERASIYALPARYEPLRTLAPRSRAERMRPGTGRYPQPSRNLGRVGAVRSPRRRGNLARSSSRSDPLAGKPHRNGPPRARSRVHFNLRRMTDAYLTAYRSLAEPATSRATPLGAAS